MQMIKIIKLSDRSKLQTFGDSGLLQYVLNFAIFIIIASFEMKLV